MIYESGGVGWDITFVDAKEYLRAGLGEDKVVGNVGELARGFFEYYADKFQMDKEVVSISSGGVVERKKSVAPPPSKPSPLPSMETLAINDDIPAVEEYHPSPEEVRRQAQEDLALLAMAEEDGRAPTTPMIDNAVISTSLPGSSDFVQPAIWTQQLIVQDPFILTRNTALNVTDQVVDVFVQVGHFLPVHSQNWTD